MVNSSIVNPEPSTGERLGEVTRKGRCKVRAADRQPAPGCQHDPSRAYEEVS